MERLEETKVLDLLWEKNKKVFLELHEEGISTEDLVSKLEQEKLDLYQEILEELGFNEEESYDGL